MHLSVYALTRRGHTNTNLNPQCIHNKMTSWLSISFGTLSLYALYIYISPTLLSCFWKMRWPTTLLKSAGEFPQPPRSLVFLPLRVHSDFFFSPSSMLVCRRSQGECLWLNVLCSLIWTTEQKKQMHFVVCRTRCCSHLS